MLVCYSAYQALYAANCLQVTETESMFRKHAEIHKMYTEWIVILSTLHTNQTPKNAAGKSCELQSNVLEPSLAK